MRLRTIAAAGAFLAASPFACIEGLYRAGLATAGELPRPPRQVVLGRAERALWVAEGEGPLVVEPQWPSTVIATFFSMAHLRRPPGTVLPALAARLFVGDKVQRGEVAPGALRRVTVEWVALVWFSRHFSGEELLAWVGEHAFFGCDAVGVREGGRACFGVAPESLTWGQAALLAGLFQAPRQPSVKRRAFVLRRLREEGVIAAWEERYANAESVPLGDGSGGCPKDVPAAARLGGEASGDR